MTHIFVSFSHTQFKFLNIIYAHNKVSHKVTNIRIQKEIKHTIKDKKKNNFIINMACNTKGQWWRHKPIAVVLHAKYSERDGYGKRGG